MATARMTSAESKKYGLTDIKAIMIGDGTEIPESPHEYLASWQIIKDKQLWRGLQGFYGRVVYDLTKQKLIQ